MVWMNKVCIVFISLILLTIIDIPTFAQAADSSTDNFWQYNLGIPTSDIDYKAVAVNDKIYVFYYDRAIMYDPSRGNYSYIKSNPAQRADFAIAAVGNSIYLMGGLIFPSTKTNINQEYDTQTDNWTPKTGYAQPIDYITANAVDGKIYVIGLGSTPVQVYNPSTDSWETKSPSPNILQKFSSCVIEDKIYIVSNDGNLYIYNTKTDSWSSGAKKPDALSTSRIAATSGVNAPKRVYVMGGYEVIGLGLKAKNYNYAYDPATDSWSTTAPLLTAVGEFAVAVVKDKIYVLGGWTNPTPTSEVQVYTPIGYSSTPLITSAPSSGSGGLSSLAVVIGVAIAAVVIAAVSITVIYFRHTPTKEKKHS
jgi:N-acetylneuraminic acid mutarotase